VFLDHEDNEAFVRQALEHAEEIAERKGVAIVIGHPKDATIKVLKEWLPTLEKKNLVVAPVSAVLRRGS
jgi:hypothetical protein